MFLAKILEFIAIKNDPQIIKYHRSMVKIMKDAGILEDEAILKYLNERL